MNTITVRGVEIGKGRTKICIPVVGKNDEEIIVQAKEAVAKNADIIEWRADYYDCVFQPECLINILEKLRCGIGNIPLIFTFRTGQEGGMRSIESAAYMRLNKMAAMSGLVDFIDVEVHREPMIVKAIMDNAHEAGAYVIGSCHDFHKTDSQAEMIMQLQEMNDSDADIVKMAVMPASMEDVLNLLMVTWKASRAGIDKPLITMSMGDMGSISRVCGEYFGSAVTFGVAGESSAPGQFEAGDLHTVLDILHKKASKIEFDRCKSQDILYLIGFMGTGKSSIARKLQEITGMEIIEMDEEIEKRSGRSISRIFDEDGELYFRTLETRLLEEIAADKKHSTIVSCGGGVVLKSENVQLMKGSGRTVLLTATPETIFQRVGCSKERPNLKNRKTVEDIQLLMDERKEKYESAADFIIETDNKNISEICTEIMHLI